MASVDTSTIPYPSPGRAERFATLQIGKLHPLVWMYLLTLALPVGFHIGSLSLSLMRVMLIVMVIPLISMLFSGRGGKILPTDILFGLHIMWASLAVAVNNPDRVVENMGSTAVEFVGGYLLGRIFIRTPEQFLALCRAIILLIIAMLPFTMYENKTGWPILIETIRSLGFDTFQNVNSYIRMGMERPQVVFAHPIHYGVFCSLMFTFAVIAFKDVVSTPVRLLFAGAIALSVFLSLSSGALLSIMIQIGFITWAIMFRNTAARWKILLGLGIVCYVIIDALSNRTPIDVFLSYATFSAHTAYWRKLIFQWGMVNVWANPVFGLGLKSWVRPHYMNSGSMDNFWLVMAVRYGIPGFLLIAAGYIDLLRRVIFRNLGNDIAVARIRLAWVITFLGFTFSLSTVHVWTTVYSFTFFLVGAGVWLATYTPAAAGESVVPVGPVRSTAQYSRDESEVQYTRRRATEPTALREAVRHARTHQQKPATVEVLDPAGESRRGGLKFTRFRRDGTADGEG